MTPIRRSLTAAVACLAVSFALGSPAFAHNEFDPAEAAPGTIIDLTLVVENESTTAGIVGVEVRFPAPLTLVALPPANGWTAQPVDGAVGSPSIGIKWTRPSGPRREDPRLPFTVGPLPDTAGQLQFKVVQTYDDGRIDRWIEEWPEGAPEPKNPGPVLRVVAGAAGTVPTTSTSSAATSTQPPAVPAPTSSNAGPTTTAPPSTTASSATIASSTSAAPAAATSVVPPTVPPGGEDAGSNRVALVAGLAVAAVAVAVAVVVVVRRRSAT